MLLPLRTGGVSSSIRAAVNERTYKNMHVIVCRGTLEYRGRVLFFLIARLAGDDVRPVEEVDAWFVVKVSTVPTRAEERYGVNSPIPRPHSRMLGSSPGLKKPFSTSQASHTIYGNPGQGSLP